ncbi:MAG: malto-oligosyltrehalose trehalohydrolase [Rhizobium sp.]|nr:malto-oligosyltrehalose trehalohydrolase [Rhizobium sp.]
MLDYSFGPILTTSGANFRIWAPRQDRMRLVLDGGDTLPMQAVEDGWHALHVEGVRPGARYGFMLDSGIVVPDPASRFQPDDVHERSELIDHGAFQWATRGWLGRPWTESVIYEAHIGTFTEVGTFLAAIERLDDLAELGITVLQLMPVADFPGRRGWGYDGVLPYAPEASYGRPDDLKSLVDAAHSRGISVMLDVVYNHLGPDGNYLPNYAPFFTDRHKTPWGDGPNFDGDAAAPVRALIVENAIYWIDEFRIDGLRLDAVHAILDDSDRHILHEIAERVRSHAGARQVHLVVENEQNDADLLDRDRTGAPTLYTAQWCDDIHHVLHSAATGESDGYYADYSGDPAKFARALAEGFVYQGEVMPHKGKPRGKPSAHLPPTAFISFIQNHDQIGNRLFGDRLGETLPDERLKALAAIYLLAPQIPMLFMGEEWAASTRFPYFCDFHDALNAAVRDGRKQEFGHDPSQAGAAEDAPDPTTEATFRSAKLRWEERKTAGHVGMLRDYRHLIALRQEHVLPLLDDIGSRRAGYLLRGSVISVHWYAGQRTLTLVVNIGAADAPAPPQGGTCIFPTPAGPPETLSPWSVFWFIE